MCSLIPNRKFYTFCPLNSFFQRSRKYFYTFCVHLAAWFPAGVRSQHLRSIWARPANLQHLHQWGWGCQPNFVTVADDSGRFDGAALAKFTGFCLETSSYSFLLLMSFVFFHSSAHLTSASSAVLKKCHCALGLVGLRKLSGRQLGPRTQLAQRDEDKTIYNHIRKKPSPSLQSHECQFLSISHGWLCLLSLAASASATLFPESSRLKPSQTVNHIELEVLASYQEDNKHPPFLSLSIWIMKLNTYLHKLASHTHKCTRTHTLNAL